MEETKEQQKEISEKEITEGIAKLYNDGWRFGLEWVDLENIHIIFRNANNPKEIYITPITVETVFQNLFGYLYLCGLEAQRQHTEQFKAGKLLVPPLHIPYCATGATLKG